MSIEHYNGYRLIIDNWLTQGREQTLVISRSSPNTERILFKVWAPEKILADPLLIYSTTNIQGFNK